MSKSTYSCNLFKEDVEGLSYFLGFICADGSLSKDRRYLWYSSSDEQIVRDLTNRLAYSRNYSCQSMRGGCKPIYNNILYGDNLQYFVDLGFVGDKDLQSLDLFPDWLDIYSFTRGYLDGDGTIRLRHGKQRVILDTISLLGRLNMIISIQKRLGGVVRSVTLRGNRTKQLFTLSFGGSFAYRLAYMLWSGSSIYLDRKKNKYLEIEDLCKFYYDNPKASRPVKSLFTKVL